MTLRAAVVKLAGAALAGSLLIAVAPAAAKPCHQHHGSGNSEVAQYVETVPGLCGDQPIGGNGAGHQGGSSQGLSGSNADTAGLPPGTISQLQSMEPPAGPEAASIAESTASGGTGGGNANGAGHSSAGSAGGTASAGGGSLLSALGHLLTGNNASAGASGEGLGAWLPILLGMVLIGGLGVLALRRGRTG